MNRGSKSREKVYQFVKEYIAEHGYAPSVRDICDGTGISSTSTVFAHLQSLDKAGLIRKTGNQPRCLVLVEDYPVNTIADMAKAYVSKGRKPPEGLSASARKLFDVMVELVKYGRGCGIREKYA